MPTTIPIRERIERQLAANIAAIAGVGACYRWDMRGTQTYAHLDALLRPEDETLDYGVQSGIPGTTTKVLTCTAIIILKPNAADTYGPAAMRNIYAGLLENNINGNPNLAETGSGVKLAEDVRVIDTEPPTNTDGEVPAAVSFQVRYRHDLNNSAKWGTAITALEE